MNVLRLDLVWIYSDADVVNKKAVANRMSDIDC